MRFLVVLALYSHALLWMSTASTECGDPGTLKDFALEFDTYIEGSESFSCTYKEKYELKNLIERIAFDAASGVKFIETSRFEVCLDKPTESFQGRRAVVALADTNNTLNSYQDQPDQQAALTLAHRALLSKHFSHRGIASGRWCDSDDIHLSYKTVKEVLYVETFDDLEGIRSWVNGRLGERVKAGFYLGPYSQGEKIEKSFKVPRNAASIEISFDILLLGKWKGGHVTGSINGMKLDFGFFHAYEKHRRSGQIGGEGAWFLIPPSRNPNESRATQRYRFKSNIPPMFYNVDGEIKLSMVFGGKKFAGIDNVIVSNVEMNRRLVGQDHRLLDEKCDHIPSSIASRTRRPTRQRTRRSSRSRYPRKSSRLSPRNNPTGRQTKSRKGVRTARCRHQEKLKHLETVIQIQINQMLPSIVKKGHCMYTKNPKATIRLKNRQDWIASPPACWDIE